MKEAAERIYRLGPRNVVITGGHLKDRAMDIHYDGLKHSVFDAPRVASNHTGGLGDTFATILAVHLARKTEGSHGDRSGKEIHRSGPGASVQNRKRERADPPQCRGLRKRRTMEFDSVNHIALMVKDAEKSALFYQHYCGMEVIHSRKNGDINVRWVQLPGQKDGFMLVLLESSPKSPKNPAGWTTSAST